MYMIYLSFYSFDIVFIRIRNLRQLTKQYYGKKLAISLYAWRLVNDVPSLKLYHQSYHQTSNISRTKSPNLNVYRLILHVPLPNPLKPGVESRMKM